MPSREIFWNIPYNYVLYILAAIAVAFWVFSIYRRYKLWQVGKPDDCSKNISKRILVFIRTAVVDILAHRRFLRDLYPGIMHLVIFWGCVILLLAAAIDAVTHYIGHHVTGAPYLWFSLIVDIGGLLILIGIIMAAYRRYIWKPERLNTILDDGIVMALIIVILFTGYLVEGLRQAATEINIHPDWAVWSPGGFVFAKAFAGMSQDALMFWHRSLWWFHSALVIGAIIYFGLVFSKLQHIVVSPLNVFFRSLKPKGALTPIDFESTEQFGVSKIEEFSWKQLLDLDACTSCGRCQDACPAYFSGKALNPKQVILNLKDHLNEVYPVPLLRKPVESRKDMISEVITDEVIWDCTTCRACMQACPVYIEHIDKIIDMRRNLAMERGQLPKDVQNTLKSLGDRGHPWRGTTATRTTWFEGLELQVMAENNNSDMLYWVGCSAALEDRNMSVSRAMAKILQAAGVNCAVLGDEEKCCGDPARRMGDEYLFQTICQNNIEILKAHNVRKILTTCPHCFNSLKYEYPQFGGDFEVIHHTQFIADLIRDGKLKCGILDGRRVAYHDSCYLGRYNDIYQEPRAILRSIGGTTGRELGRSGTRSFCCGGGGGHIWMEEDPGKRVNERRVEEIIQARVDIVATACPYCLTMFEDGVKAKEAEETLRVKDLSELVVEALGKDG